MVCKLKVCNVWKEGMWCIVVCKWKVHDAPVSVRKVYYQSGISVMLSHNINSPVVCKSTKE